MKINVENFKKCKSAELELAPKITFIDGKNGSGKSTLLNAMQILFSGKVNVSKAQAHTCVSYGKSSSKISGNGMSVSFPKLNIAGEPAIRISEHSSSIRESVLLKQKKDFAQFFTDIMGVEPTYEDFYNACGFIKDSERAEKIKPYWEKIQVIGFDKVCKSVEDIAKGKRQLWREITTENYGSAKAENWKHDDYTQELDNLSENQLKTEVEQAKEIYKSAIAASAVDEEKLKELEKKIQEKSKIENDFESSSKKYKEKQEEIKAIKKEINQLEGKEDDLEEKLRTENNKLICPHCQMSVKYYNNDLVEFEAMTDEEILKIKTEIGKIQDKLNELDGKLSTLSNESLKISSDGTLLKEKLNEIEKAELEIAKYSGEKMKESPEHCAEIVEKWERFLNAYQVTKKADETHQAYCFYKSMSSVLSVDGIRKTKVSEAVGKFNKIIKKVFSKWDYEADDDFQILNKNGESYDSFSDGEKWCARVVYQVVSALIQNEKIVLIDVIEDVDRSKFLEFVGQVYNTDLQVVIARASDGDKEKIELEKKQGCKRYTMIDGVAECN